MKSRNFDNIKPSRILLDASSQRGKKVFVPSFHNTNNGAKKVETNSYKKYFRPKVNIITMY